MCDRVGADTSTPYSPNNRRDDDPPQPSSPPSVSVLSLSEHTRTAPPRCSMETSPSATRHGAHGAHGPHPPEQLPPLEHRPSSPVILPSFNTLESMIRRGSPTDPIHLTTHPPISLGSPRAPLKPFKPSWKSDYMDMVIDPPSASSAVAGQQLNIPAPSQPKGYPGMKLVLGDTQRKSRVETQIKQIITLEFNAERVLQYHYIHVPPSASVKRYKTPPKNVSPNAILRLEALAIPASYPAVQAFCCRTCYAREAKRKPEAYQDPPTQNNLSPIDFACSEYLEFSNGTALIPFRIICYSRHHSEKEGFNVRLILWNQQGDVVAAVQTPAIMITDDRKAVKRSIIAAAEANGVALGLPPDRKRTLDCVEDPGDVTMPKTTRQRTSNSGPTRDYHGYAQGQAHAHTHTHAHAHTHAHTSSNPYKPGKPQQGLYSQPSSLHPSLAHAAAQLASLDGVFPNKGPTTGGIKVAVTGVLLTPTSTVSFGGVPALDIAYKCDRLVICVLPSASSPGPVPVSLAGAPTDPKVPFPSFSYEGERKDNSAMISTALSVMAYWETGKLEEAIDVANRVLAANSSEKRITTDKKTMYDRNVSRVRVSPNDH